MKVGRKTIPSCLARDPAVTSADWVVSDFLLWPHVFAYWALSWIRVLRSNIFLYFFIAQLNDDTYSGRASLDAICEQAAYTAQVHYGGDQADYRVKFKAVKGGIYAKVVRSPNHRVLTGKPVSETDDLDEIKYRAVLQMLEDVESLW